ncbi:Rieske 2Fe-2S domain-containing protein [Streptomyces qinzhouensis]|uniref:Rieske-type oxygenase n=1 Tax=Streptomyces qinzhouensis TaxID=2599401 RepID=A0A5B8IQV0_9ACTN|nr:Rieske 2Fe-2S domain-containing protein [Streptomyces qinzhouensis]QDY79989.1 Rieske (2Fe-2S) protein [Streptomyces qinzhouensis]
MSDARKFRLKHTSAPAPADTLRPPVLPDPNGWFCLAFSHELKPRRVLTRPLLGEEVVLYRTAAGRLRAIRPYCPHLGAHLGAGGKVSGENIVCPFHKFAFDPSGHCVRTGYGQKPPKADLVHYPVTEANGSVYVWRHALGTDPDWEVPNLYTPRAVAPSHDTFELAVHPQDLAENAFDYGHLTQLHGLSELNLEGGPVLGEKVSVLQGSTRRPLPFLRGPRLSYTVTVIGLATFMIEMTFPKVRTSMYLMIHFTPIRPGRSHVRIGTAAEVDGLPFLGSAGAPAARLVSRLLTVLAQRWSCRDLFKDFPIWNHQLHTEHPRLAPGDGPIGLYRRWAQQFYTQPAETTAHDEPPHDTSTGPAR